MDSPSITFMVFYLKKDKMQNPITRLLRYFTKGLFESEIEKAGKYDTICEVSKEDPFDATVQLKAANFQYANLFQIIASLKKEVVQYIAERNEARQEIAGQAMVHIDEIAKMAQKHTLELSTAKDLLAEAIDKLRVSGEQLQVANGLATEKEGAITKLKDELHDSVAREQQVVYQLLHHYSKFKIESTEALLKRYAEIHPEWLKIKEKENNTNETA